MSQEYGAEIGVPLLVSLVALAVAAGTLLWRGASLLRRWRLLEGRWALWAMFVTLVFLAANQLLVRGVAVGRWDADGQFFPYYVLVADHARAAQLVQWDPWSNGGLPAMADPQVGAYSPVQVLLGLATGGTSAGFTAYWLLLWWLGGVGMLLLGRHLGAPPWGATAVALGFLFCGAYTGNAEHTSWIAAFSFLPVTIWRLDVALTAERAGPAVEAGALWGLSALAGYPGVVIATGCFAALWAVGRALTGSAIHGSAAVRPAFGVGVLALVLGTGLLVVSPLYLAFFLDAAGTTPRVGPLTRDAALGNALDPGAVATFASPYLAALKVVSHFAPAAEGPGPLWPATDPSMVSIYAGALVPLLALFALVGQPRDRWRWWLTALAGLSLACAVGESLPFRGWLYDLVYPTRFFRHPALFRLYYLFSIAVLALLAMRDLSADLRRGNRPGAWLFFACAVLTALLALVAIAPFAGPRWSGGIPHKGALLGAAHFVGVWLGCCIVAFLAWRLLPRRLEIVPVLLVMLTAGDALLTSVLSIPTVLRIGPEVERWRELDSRHDPHLELTAKGLLRAASACEDVPPPERCRRNDQLITKTPVFDAYATEKNPFQAAMASHPILRGMATGSDRLWFSRQVARLPTTLPAFAAFAAKAESLGAPPLVIRSAESPPRKAAGDAPSTASDSGGLALARLSAARRVSYEVVRYSPGELLLEVQVPEAGWLLVTDRWARGWRAEVNGERSHVEVGNFIFRALRVPEGRNTVRMTYNPASSPWLLLLSWGTLLVVAWRSLRPLSRRRVATGEPEPHLPSSRFANR